MTPFYDFGSRLLSCSIGVHKMATERLYLQPEEPGDDHTSDQVFDILCNTLQSKPELPAKVAVAKIIALIPGREIRSSELNAFVMTCYEVAEQIPHNHESLIKLVTIIDLCYNALFPMDHLEYVNFQAFIARIIQRGLLSVCNLAIWTIQDAFERREGKSQVNRNAYVQAALQYLVIVGDQIFQEVIEKRDSNEWDSWYKQVGAVAAQESDDKSCVYDQDVVQLAGRAMVVMEAIQRLKTG
nr:hypothetical protein CFP56_36210 [Quercus suber]